MKYHGYLEDGGNIKRKRSKVGSPPQTLTYLSLPTIGIRTTRANVANIVESELRFAETSNK